jgi:hypothetical protein
VLLAILDVIPIVNFIVLGYIGNIMKQPKDSNQLPPLENYGELFIQGLKIIVACVILMIVPLVLAASALITLVISMIGLGYSFTPFIGLGLSIPLLYLGVALAFFIALILAMSIVSMLKTGDFGKAFAFSEAMAIINKIGWGTYIIWLLILFIGAGIVSAIVGNIPVIGWILGMLVAPIIGVFIARSVSLTYLEGTETQTPEPAPAEQA